MPDLDTPLTPAVPEVPQDGQLELPLRQATGAFTTPEGKEWATGVAADIQQHLNLTHVADGNAAVGQQFERNINEVKNNLVGMVNDDPTSADLAVGLVPKLLGPMLGHMGEDAAGPHQELTSAFQQEIAHAAVIRMADFHDGEAHALMDRLEPYLGGDDNRNALGQYVDTLQVARNADNAVASQQLASQQSRASGIAAYNYGTGLLDPKTEDVQFPRNYLTNLVKNPAIQPDDKEALFAAHGALVNRGDAPQSDPFVVNNLLNRMAKGDDVSHLELMQHVGGDLKYADALMLHGLTTTRTPEFDGHINDLANVLNDARSKLTDGTRAGDAAFGRFTDWFLPAYRRTGTAGFDPKSENYLFANTSLDNFRPRASDLVPSRAPRRPLSEIFRG